MERENHPICYFALPKLILIDNIFANENSGSQLTRLIVPLGKNTYFIIQSRDEFY